ncbi:MAG: sulfatase, partial [Spirochaetaceae bacterium]
KPMNRPNILLIMADQQRADALGIHRPWLKTPALDRLANEGLSVNRCYPPTPVCLPCRASMATGQFPSTHGARHNESGLPLDYPVTSASAFQRAGYFTHMIGKSHISSVHNPSSPESAPDIYNFAHYRQWHGPWYGFERADINVGHSTEKHAASMHYGAWLEDRGVDIQKYFGIGAYTDYGTWDLPEEHHSSTWVAETSIASMRQACTEGRPFFQWVNFQDPHNPCMVPEPWASMYRDAPIPDHGFFDGEPESFQQKPAFYQELLEQPGEYACRPSDPGLPGVSNTSSFDWPPDKVRENAAHYYGMVSLIDKHVGRMLDALDSLGIAENTIVIYASDHGDLLGDHGLFWKGVAAFEESMRVPFLVRAPGVIPAGRSTDALHSLLDVYPTLLELIGARAPRTFEGLSQREVWTGKAESVRDSVVVEEQPADTDFVQRILIDEQYKTVYYAGRPLGELYDMKRDPNQIHNLWQVDEYRAVRDERIRVILDRELRRTRPNRIGES